MSATGLYGPPSPPLANGPLTPNQIPYPNASGALTGDIYFTRDAVTGALVIKDLSGDVRYVVTNYAARKVDITDGSVASPLTSFGPTVRISRTEQFSTLPTSGSAGDNESNAALMVTSVNPNAASTMQNNAIIGQVLSGNTSNNDSFAVFAEAKKFGIGALGIAGGLFAQGRRDVATASVTGVEANCNNFTATPGVVNANGYSDTTAVWVSADGLSDSAVGIGLGTVVPDTTHFLVGINITQKSISASGVGIQDSSTANVAHKLLGTYVYGIHMGGATISGSAILIPNNKAVSSRNAGNSADVVLFNLGGTNVLNLYGGQATLDASGNLVTLGAITATTGLTATNGVTVNGTATYGLDMNTATISGSALRVPNNKGIASRNAANSGDISMVTLGGDNNLYLRGVAVKIDATGNIFPGGVYDWATGNVQTTVGAAGGASAPPATPTKWGKVTSNGVTYVVPMYAAS